MEVAKVLLSAVMRGLTLECYFPNALICVDDIGPMVGFSFEEAGIVLESVEDLRSLLRRLSLSAMRCSIIQRHCRGFRCECPMTGKLDCVKQSVDISRELLVLLDTTCPSQ